MPAIERYFKVSGTTFVWLYLVGAAYAVGTFALSSALAIVTLVAGFGLLMLVYVALEWFATPLVAILAGAQARWSVLRSLTVGIPLIGLWTVATPIVKADLHMMLPWLSVGGATWERMQPVIGSRLIIWFVLFAVAIAGALASRVIHPVQDPVASPMVGTSDEKH